MTSGRAGGRQLCPRVPSWLRVAGVVCDTDACRRGTCVGSCCGCRTSRSDALPRAGLQHTMCMNQLKHTHMRTNIVIDDEFMNEALRATGLKTKREAVELGLQTLLRLCRQAESSGQRPRRQRCHELRARRPWCRRCSGCKWLPPPSIAIDDPVLEFSQSDAGRHPRGGLGRARDQGFAVYQWHTRSTFGLLTLAGRWIDDSMTNRVHPTSFDADNSSGSCLPATRSDWRTDDADCIRVRDICTTPPQMPAIRLEAIPQQPEISVSFVPLSGSPNTRGQPPPSDRTHKATAEALEFMRPDIA